MATTYQQILLFSMVQGGILVLALTIKIYPQKNKNTYFLTLIFLITLLLSMHSAFSKERYEASPHIWYAADGIAYFIGFLWWLTLRKSIRVVPPFKILDWVFLAPTGYHLGFLIWLAFKSKTQVLAMDGEPWFQQTFYWFTGTVLLTNGYFFIKSHYLIESMKESGFPLLLRNGQKAFLIILLIWLSAFGLSLLWPPANISEMAYHVAFLSLSILIFAWAFLAILKPASFYFLTQTFDNQETPMLREIAKRIREHLLNDSPYMNANFSLQDLANTVEVNPVLTSKAINRILGQSFSELVNSYRIQQFIQEAREEKWQHLTHWAIAQRAGFGNKMSFYSTFKKLQGTTPRNYLEQLSGTK